MSEKKRDPLVWWTAAGVLSVIALGLLAWIGTGVSSAFTLQNTVAAHDKELADHEQRLRDFEAMKTDIGVIKTEVESIHETLNQGERK